MNYNNIISGILSFTIFRIFRNSKMLKLCLMRGEWLTRGCPRSYRLSAGRALERCSETKRNRPIPDSLLQSECDECHNEGRWIIMKYYV